MNKYFNSELNTELKKRIEIEVYNDPDIQQCYKVNSKEYFYRYVPVKNNYLSAAWSYANFILIIQRIITDITVDNINELSDDKINSIFNFIKTDEFKNYCNSIFELGIKKGYFKK